MACAEAVHSGIVDSPARLFAPEHQSELHAWMHAVTYKFVGACSVVEQTEEG